MMAVSSDEKSKLFVAQFSTNFNLDSQGKQPPKIPDGESSITEIVFKHRTIRHILDGQNVNKFAGSDWMPPLIVKKCALELTPVRFKLFSQPTLQELFRKYVKMQEFKQYLKGK